MELIYVVILVAIQAGVLFVTGANLLAVITNIAGVIYVSTLVFKKKYTFLAAMIFNAGCLIIGLQHGIYSEIIQQPMFFAANLIGFMHMNFKGNMPTVDRILDKIGAVTPWKVILTSVVVTILWSGVSYYLGSPIWWKDGLLGGIAISAQVFSIAENKYSWYYWMALNAVSLFTWFTLGNVAMGVLYSVYLFNAVLGLYFWSKEEKNKETVIETT